MSLFILELVITHTVLILAYWLFLSRENDYSKMRFYLIAATVFSIILPFLRLPKLYPSDTQALQDVEGVVVTFSPTVLVATETPIITFERIMFFSLLVSAFFLYKLISRILFLVSLERRCSAETFKGFQIRRAPILEGSFTFFNWIFINTNIGFSQKEFFAIMKHEQSHVRLGHSYDVVFFEVYKAFFWWLPSAWYINKEIRNVHEYQADAYVLKSINIDQYSSVLIKSTLQSNGLNIASSFHNGLIFKRLKAMKKQTNNVQSWKIGLLTSLCLFLIVTLACSEDKRLMIRDTIQKEIPQGEQNKFTIVEEQPSYKGGLSAFYSYVINEMRYPLEARKNGVEGVVQVGFVIERDGSVSNVRTINGMGSGCDKEAVNVIKNATGFTPGSQRGRAVRVAMAMPITFKLNPEKKNPDNSVQGIVIAGEVTPNNGTLEVRASNNKGQWSGTVLSPEGDALPGANIVIAGTNKGTVSDRDGSFSLIAEKDQEVWVSFVGYQSVILK